MPLRLSLPRPRKKMKGNIDSDARHPLRTQQAPKQNACAVQKPYNRRRMDSVGFERRRTQSYLQSKTGTTISAHQDGSNRVLTRRRTQPHFTTAAHAMASIFACMIAHQANSTLRPKSRSQVCRKYAAKLQHFFGQPITVVCSLSASVAAFAITA